MKKAAVLLAALTLLLFMACGKIPPGNPSQSQPSNAPAPEAMPSAGSASLADFPAADEPAQPQNAEAGNSSVEAAQNENVSEKSAMTNISITVGSSVFSAKLYDNEAARALLAQFPMTLNMSELNGNEKYYYLADNLPSESAERPVTINAGDIMCWSGNCLVLFYETFSNSYGGYVRLGYVDDAPGLAATLGSGDVKVTFAAGS